MTTYQETEALKDALYNEQITYGEFVSRLSKIRSKCDHKNTIAMADENDYYVECSDCGEEL